MKILIVNTSDIQGGAARAAYRLHKALLSQDIDSRMLVQNKSSDDFTVLTNDSKIVKGLNLFRFMIDQLPLSFYQNKTRALFSTAWLRSGIIKEINKINPDVVHLHWICGGLLRLEDLRKIKAPIIWSLHDMWAFTGGCHYDDKCAEYKKKCGKCKILKSNKERDISRRVFNRKKKVFLKINSMTIVGVSRWLNKCSKESVLLGGKRHINLPNPINTNKFKPLDKKEGRKLWGLSQNKKIILFGAMNATGDPRKGFDQLNEALKKLKKTEDVELVVFGSSKPKQPKDFGFKTCYLGHLHDDVSLVTLYSAVDVMIVPSLQEAFGQTASEAMACSTPVVAFNTTGLMDIVDHKTNGYLANSFDAIDLKNGIEWVLNNPNYDNLCKNARKKVLKEFDSKVIARKYINLYKEVLKKGN